ncbi:MAG: hypothetical protein ACM309_09640, partial [Bacillota bacterium]
MPRVMWRCKCGKLNRTSVDTVDLDPAELGDDPDSGVFREAKCSGCGGKHWLLVVFRVEADVQQVKTDEEYQTMLAEKEKEVEETRRKGYTRPCRVSRDNGKTWQDMDICLLDTDPATSPLKEGDLAQRRDLPADDPYARVHRIILREG